MEHETTLICLIIRIYLTQHLNRESNMYESKVKDFSFQYSKGNNSLQNSPIVDIFKLS